MSHDELMWKPVGEKLDNGHQPRVPREWVLVKHPLVFGNIRFSHAASGVDWWLFEPSCAMHVNFGRFVKLSSVAELVR